MSLDVYLESERCNHFHSTPDQVASDRRRDAFMRARGWHVLRFTGRAIRRDPLSCAADVRDLMRRLEV